MLYNTESGISILLIYHNSVNNSLICFYLEIKLFVFLI